MPIISVHRSVSESNQTVGVQHVDFSGILLVGTNWRNLENLLQLLTDLPVCGVKILEFIGYHIEEYDKVVCWCERDVLGQYLVVAALHQF